MSLMEQVHFSLVHVLLGNPRSLDELTSYMYPNNEHHSP